MNKWIKRAAFAIFVPSVVVAGYYGTVAVVKVRRKKNMFEIWKDSAGEKGVALDELAIKKELKKLDADEIKTLSQWTNANYSDDNNLPKLDEAKKKELNDKAMAIMKKTNLQILIEPVLA
jgi:hypothetical protein